MATEQIDRQDAFRLRIDAICNCRSIVEIMLEAAEQQELAGYRSSDRKASRRQYEQNLQSLPYYALIERIRIHDFHRFGLLPSDPHFTSTFIGGPITVTAQRGAAQVTLEGTGLEVSATGNSHVKLQRPLVSIDGKFLDDLNNWIAPEVLADEFLREVAATLDQFEQDVR